MAKAGFWLAGARGKMAGSIIKAGVGGGTQIAAAPASVSNPRTSGQIKVRSKFKLLSQLAASLAPVIAIPRDGALSPRNQFTSINSDKVRTTDGVAQISLENVQITKSKRALPQIIATRNAAGADASLKLAMANDVTNMASRVVYVIMRKNSEGNLENVASAITAVTAENPTAEVTYTKQDLSESNIVILAYGMLDKDAAATVKYGDMHVEAASDIAKLIVSKTITTSDYTFTETRGASMDAGTGSIEPVAPNKVRVYVTAVGDGTVTGAGTYDIGAEVTVTATPVKPAGATSTTFVGWKKNDGQGTEVVVSTEASYKFTAPAETVDLIAEFKTVYPSQGGGSTDEN